MINIFNLNKSSMNVKLIGLHHEKNPRKMSQKNRDQ